VCITTEVVSSNRGVLDTLCDQVCQLLATGQCTPVSSNNKTDLHDITEILLKVALSTITPCLLIGTVQSETLRDKSL